jgi:hypothetical protein
VISPFGIAIGALAGGATEVVVAVPQHGVTAPQQEVPQPLLQQLLLRFWNKRFERQQLLVPQLLVPQLLHDLVAQHGVAC